MKNVLASIRKKIHQNFSLFILALGTGSNFLLILFIKNYHTASVFNSYSLFLTYLGIVSSFGLIGLDQVFLRISKVNKKRVLVNEDILHYLMICTIGVPLLMSYYFYYKDQNIFLYQYIVSGIGINIIIFSYNLFRLSKEFSLAQLIKNGFRILFLVVIILLYLFHIIVGIRELIDIITILILSFAIFGLATCYSKIKESKKKSLNFLRFFFSFSFNLAILTLLSFGERIFILDNIGENDFGKYFYYSNIFLFPLTLIQQYVGFKELVGFKEGIQKHLVISKIKKMIFLGFLIIIIVFMVSYLDKGKYLDVDFSNDLLLIILLSVLGLIKLIYGLFSAILGALGIAKDIFYINIITISLIAVALFFLNIFKITLVTVTICLIFIFFLRSLFIYIKYVHDSKLYGKS